MKNYKLINKIENKRNGLDKCWRRLGVSGEMKTVKNELVAMMKARENTDDSCISKEYVYKWIDLYNELEKQYDSMYDENENSTVPEEVLNSMILKIVRAESLVLECILNDRRDIEFDTSLMNFLDQKVFN